MSTDSLQSQKTASTLYWGLSLLVYPVDYSLGYLKRCVKSFLNPPISHVSLEIWMTSMTKTVASQKLLKKMSQSN